MKQLFLFVFFISFSVHARQYIQCAHYDSDDRAVINLNGDKSTLFLTNGVHLPDEVRVLKKLYPAGVDGKYTLFETREGEVKERVLVPSKVIHKASPSFEVILEMGRVSGGNVLSFPMSCYSALYP